MYTCSRYDIHVHIVDIKYRNNVLQIIHVYTVYMGATLQYEVREFMYQSFPSAGAVHPSVKQTSEGTVMRIHATCA